VGIVSVIIIFFLKALKVSRPRWVFVIGPLLIFYVFVTGARPSAVRACVMAVIYFAGPLCKRKADPFSSLAAAALVILAWDPRQLFDIGFVYSFIVVAGIIVLYPVFERPLRPLWQPDVLRLQPERRVVRLARGVGRMLAQCAALSCAAWLTSTPLTVYLFGRFVPGALLSNILVVPMAFLIVVSGCLSLSLGPCLPVLGEIFNHAAVTVIALLVKCMGALRQIPLLCIDLVPPPLWTVWAWYALLALILLNRLTYAMVGEKRSGDYE